MLKISRHIENIGVHDEENALMYEPEDLQEPQLEDDFEHDPVCEHWALNIQYICFGIF